MPADTVMVTGAAGLIGSATARALRTDGHRVVGLDRKPPPHGAAADWLQHDLLDTAGTEALIAASPLLAGLRHVVAVAGGPVGEELGKLHPADVPVDVFERSVQLNLVAQYALVRAVVARFEEESPAGDRSITLFSSINALRGYGMPGYSAAKAGLLGLVVSLALPLGRRGVRINAITPGTVVSEGGRSHDPTGGRLEERLLGAAASERATNADDIAQAVCSVVGLRQMTGQQLVIDGGQLAVPLDHYPLV